MGQVSRTCIAVNGFPWRQTQLTQTTDLLYNRLDKMNTVCVGRYVLHSGFILLRNFLSLPLSLSLCSPGSPSGLPIISATSSTSGTGRHGNTTTHSRQTVHHKNKFCAQKISHATCKNGPHPLKEPSYVLQTALKPWIFSLLPLIQVSSLPI